MNGVIKRRTGRSFTLKELIATLLEIADEGVFNFKNLAVKATMYVPMRARLPQAFFSRHTTKVASDFLSKEVSRMQSLHLEALLDLTRSSGTKGRAGREAASEMVFQMWRRDSISNGNTDNGTSCLQRVRLSAELFEAQGGSGSFKSPFEGGGGSGTE